MEINGGEYKIGKLSAFQQFHVSRKIAPILPTLIPIFLRMAKTPGGGLEKLPDLADVLTPFAEGIAQMSNEDSEFVLSTCLGAVKRLHQKDYTPVWSDRGNVCLFDDMDLSVMIRLTIEVIKDSLQPFIRGLLTSQNSDPVKQ